ncbi:MAG: hypothetical protein ACTTKH_00695 [Treponema sp.]
MKKISLFIIFSFLVLSFIACRTGNNSNVNDDDESGGGTDIENNGEQITFNVTVNDLSPIKGRFRVEPSKDGVTYAMGIMTKKRYEAEKAKGEKTAQQEGVDTKFAMYFFDRSFYAGVAKTLGLTWKEFAKLQGYYKTGVVEGDIVSPAYINAGDIRPDQDFIIYWYLIDEKSNLPKSEIFTKEEKTPKAPEKISNDLVANITTHSAQGLKFTMTAPSGNTNKYVFVVTRKSYFEWYKPDNPANKDKLNKVDCMYNLLKDGVHGTKILRTGSGSGSYILSEVDMPDFGRDTEGFLLYCYYDEQNGILSDVKEVLFKI